MNPEKNHPHFSFPVKILLVFLVIFLSLLTLEIFARFALPKPQRVVLGISDPRQTVDLKGSFLKVFQEPKNEEPNPEALFYSTDSGMRLNRNMKAIWKNHFLSKKDIDITTNSLGYRYPELGQKKSDEYRILTLGDSITLGDYAQFQDTYTYHIEQNLKKQTTARLKGKDIKVINAGVGSIGIENELAILQETGLSVKPDIVLLQLYLNDAKESLTLKILRPPSFTSNSYLIRYIYDIINKKRSWDLYQFVKTDPSNEAIDFQKSHPMADQDWKDNEKGFNKLIYENFDDWGYAWSENGIEKMKQAVTLMNETAQDNNTQLIVLLFPVSYQVETSFLKNGPQQKLKTVLDNLNITNYDLLPALREKYQRDKLTMFYDHCHYNPAGNAFIGKKISEFLVTKLLPAENL